MCSRGKQLGSANPTGGTAATDSTVVTLGGALTAEPAALQGQRLAQGVCCGAVRAQLGHAAGSALP